MSEPAQATGDSGTVDRVYQGILADLEGGALIPGQRLVETELAARFGAGRNAVREAMQRLAARGVVDLSRHRSPAIRKLDAAETLEVLDVAEAMTALLVSTAALRFDPESHAADLARAAAMIEEAEASDDPVAFSRARRHFYRMLLQVGGNRELMRLFPAIGMHIIYAQHQSRSLRGLRIAHYREILNAVEARDVTRAERAGRDHLAQVRRVIMAAPARAGAGGW